MVDLHVLQLHRPLGRPQKVRLLLDALDKHHLRIRPNDRQRNPRHPTPTADVGDRTFPRWQERQQRHRIADVKHLRVRPIANASQVHLLVHLEQEIEVARLSLAVFGGNVTHRPPYAASRSVAGFDHGPGCPFGPAHRATSAAVRTTPRRVPYPVGDGASPDNSGSKSCTRLLV